MYKLTDHIWLFPGSLETDRPVLALITGVRRSLFIDTGNSSKLATDLYTSLLAYDADLDVDSHVNDPISRNGLKVRSSEALESAHDQPSLRVAPRRRAG